MDVMFSVVIPALNEEKFLPTLLSCLVKQTYRSFEVIVVDAHSTDATVAEVNKFKKHLPSLTVIQDGKKNVSLQRNAGAAEATGNYLVFFDADVQIPVNFLQEIATEIKKNNAQLLTTLLIAPDHDIRKQFITFSWNVFMVIWNALRKPIVGGFNIIIKRSVFTDIGGFDPTIIHAEDVDFVRQIVRSGVPLTIVQTTRQTLSFRRQEELGYFVVTSKHILASVHLTLFGPIRKPLFDYPMGGQVYSGSKVKKL